MARLRKLPEINASSMADIAFLLLIFFLVTTTMDIDKGLAVNLPPMQEDMPPTNDNINKRNALDILINGQDQLLVEGEPLEINELRELTKKHVGNYGADPLFSENPKKAVVSLKNHQGTKYDTYITVQNELRAAYNELRDEYAERYFGRTFDKLPDAHKRVVRAEYPLKISEAEPDQTGNE